MPVKAYEGAERPGIPDRIRWECMWAASNNQSMERLDALELDGRDVSGLRISNARLADSAFSNVDLHGASFTDANISGARFHDVNLSASSFGDANLRDVRIVDSNVDGMTIDGILVTDLMTAYRSLQKS